MIYNVLKKPKGHIGVTLPGGVPPAHWDSGADMFPVEQKSSRHGASNKRQDPEMSFGGQDSCEAACHFFCFSYLNVLNTYYFHSYRDRGTGVRERRWWRASGGMIRGWQRDLTGATSRRTETGGVSPEVKILFQHKSTNCKDHLF